MQIAGSVVLVTGAASGLGEATARHLHAQGAKMVLVDLNAARLQTIADELGSGAVWVAADCTDETAVQIAVDAATGLGGLRAVVACAGGASASKKIVQRDGSAHDLDLFRRTQELNVTTTFNTLRLAAAAMNALEPVDEDGLRGVIVTTASIAGYEGQIGQIAYGAAKAAIIGMTIIAARDLASNGIRVNCIAPGTIGTSAWDAAPEGLRESLEAKVPFPKRLGRPDEFARLAEHLIENDYMNGHVARIDGAIRFEPR